MPAETAMASPGCSTSWSSRTLTSTPGSPGKAAMTLSSAITASRDQPRPCAASTRRLARTARSRGSTARSRRADATGSPMRTRSTMSAAAPASASSAAASSGSRHPAWMSKGSRAMSISAFSASSAKSGDRRAQPWRARSASGWTWIDRGVAAARSFTSGMPRCASRSASAHPASGPSTTSVRPDGCAPNHSSAWGDPVAPCHRASPSTIPQS